MAAPLAPSQIPSVDRVLSLPAVQALAQAHGRALVTAAVRTSLSDLRAQAQAGVLSASEIERIAERVHARVGAVLTPNLRAVHNLTGTVLHTNLGRALLPPHALDALQLVLTQACNLEYDLESGARGDRDDLIVPLLRQLTGAPAATVVNNNAAATLIALSTLAKGKEVIVSRGELVEIGASYRIPEIMASAGCRLREVGTTNRTHLSDYASAIGTKTAALLKVHTSNYRIDGYTAAPEERELAALAHRHQLPYVVDLGSGALIDMKRLGLPHEPTVQEALHAGADLVTFSGDKLLGGPQAGLILGRADLIARIKKNPLKRALRVDKLTLACLESVLRLYLDPDRLAHSLPTLRLLLRPQAQIKAQAERVAPALRTALGAQYRLEIAECMSQIGSGALPVDTLPSTALRITPTAGKGVGAALSRLERALRALPTPVIGRVQDDALWLDLRCLGDEAGLLAQLPQLRLSPSLSRPSP